MDKQLKHLKKQYESEINLTFTESDKKAVLAKIKKGKQPTRKRLHLRLIPVVAAAALFVLLAITFNSIPELFSKMRNSASDYSIESQNDSDTMVEMDGAYENESFNMKDSDVDIAEDSESSDGDHSGNDQAAHDRDISSDGSNLLFNPDSVESGLTYGNMEVTDVKKQGDETIISFKGNTWLSGNFNYRNNQISFNPDNRTLLDFPLARSDKHGDIPFYFQDETIVKVMYGAARGGTPIQQANDGFMLDVIGAEYVFTPNGSQVHLDIRDTLEVNKESYISTINLDETLNELYTNYADTLDDRLLNELRPIEVFKLYHHALQNNDVEVLYSLYIKGETYGTPDKETYFEKRSMYEADQQQMNDLYVELQNRETTFEEIYTNQGNEEMAFVMFPSEEGHWPNSFSLIKNEEGIWKVYLLPLN
ncbi:helix-turn-helix domain-containing protein [Ornithinibacillus halophilus]|uniref:Uncharacterized protein n=1 Tax=Ornithinibacillus halophilus TaxID=930117 RepID=A0A1M5KA99_9BACI|nr:hypothetical protein [Ornithinibacillus halophilus]SHG49668.1 hypothetical protein SAMN05216225_10373 [Ornithinibacillus halophilus]